MITSGMKMLTSFVGLIALVFGIMAEDSEYVARLIKKQGTVQIYSNPSTKNPQGPGPHVKYEGTIYSTREGKLGDKILPNDMLKTGADSQARIVYVNGDQFNVGPSTTYKVELVTKPGQKPQTVVNLMFGSVRSIVSKTGPRNNLKVKTQNAAMGVRGTDFFVDKRGNLHETKVSVLRGEVAVQMSETKAPEVKLEKGFTAAIPVAAVVKEELNKVLEAQDKLIEKKEEGKPTEEEIKQVETAVVALIKVEQTNKQELIQIQKVSRIEVTKEEEKKIENELAPVVAAEIKKLEETSKESILEDIKQDDPTLHAALMKKTEIEVTDLNTNVVKTLLDKAPEAKYKATEKDLDTDSDLYKKYFKVE